MRLIPFSKSNSFSTAEIDAHEGIEEELVFLDHINDRDLAEIIFFRQAAFDGRDGLIQTAVIEPHRLFGIDRGFDGKHAPSCRKTG